MTTSCRLDNATMSPAPSRWYGLGGELESSYRSVISEHYGFFGAGDRDAHGPGYVTKEELQQFAQRRIAESMSLPTGWDDDGGLPVSARAAKLAMLMCLDLLVADNLATPQISPDGNGGIDIEWLVSRKHLSMSVSDDGALVIWGTREDGTEVFSFDSTEDPIERELIALTLKQAREFLREISAGVRNRLPIR